MIDIAFVTTNNVKLAHARYLCRNFEINIIQHKLLHYGKGYEEPRIFERATLLEQSVKDAILRWKRNISASENRLYFIEDTSVKIFALSTEDIEFPGVDIKYWMRENTFSSIDLQLKLKGNYRKIAVNSHVVLVLTKDLKEKYNAEFLIFSSTTTGELVESEIFFDTNLIYPWLDNKSFNKWFVPDGESLPISMLPIESADKHDFRKGAFEQMLQFLVKNNKIFEKRNKEIDFKFIFAPLFLISGPTCAGKTTLGKYLLENFNYYHIEASDFMTLEFLETHGNKSSIEIGDFAKEILKVKPYVVVERIFSYLTEIQDISSLVITGFRTPAEIEYFKTFSPLRGNICVIFVDADYNIRYNRWIIRKRDNKDDQKWKFDASNRLQEEMGLNLIHSIEDIYTISNNESFDSYFNLFYYSFLHDLSIKTEQKTFEFSKIIPKNLEDAIILTLADDYQSQNQLYSTTTEISHKINKLFNSLPMKHKDNVSRYFNQRFYPFYELKSTDKKIKYKLSPTGYSKALSLLKKVYLASSE